MNKLRPWQQKPANRLLEILRTGNAVDMSETGTGKTAVSAYVISQLKLPTLVIAPKISLTSWKRMLELFGTSSSITNYEQLTMGTTPFGSFEKPIKRGQHLFICANCQRKYGSEERPDRCYAVSTGIHCFSKKPIKQKRGRWVWAPQVKFIVADECQRTTAIKSLNAELIIGARRQGIKLLGLSATLATTPLQFRAWGYALDLFSDANAGFYSWSRRHGCGRLSALPGWRVIVGAERQKEIMASINADLIPARGVRLTTESIPNFPARSVSVELYDLGAEKEINELYKKMAPLAKRTTEDAANELPIVQQLRCRMRLELFKVPIAVELCADARAKGQAVAIFCSFKDTIAELRKRLNCDCFIDGSQTAGERQKCLDDFQFDHQQIILVNSKAGGVACNLHDLCDRSRLGILFPSFSAVEYIQVLGRLHRDGALSPAMYKIVLVANSVEEKIFKALKQKENNLDALNDSDLTPTDL